LWPTHRELLLTTAVKLGNISHVTYYMLVAQITPIYQHN
jgi:hypothetical protein